MDWEKEKTMETNLEAKAEVAAKYDHTDQTLQQVAEQHKDKTVTPENYDEAKAVMKDVKALENAIETRRVELKAFYLEGGRAVDARAKELKGIILPVIENIKNQMAVIDQKKAEEKMRQERAEILPSRKEKCASLKIEKTDDELLFMPDITFMKMISDAQTSALAEAQKIIEQQKSEALAAENENKRLAELEQAKLDAARLATEQAELRARQDVQQAEQRAASAEALAKKAESDRLAKQDADRVAKEKSIREAGDEAMVNHWLNQMLSIPRPEVSADSDAAKFVSGLVHSMETALNL